MNNLAKTRPLNKPQTLSDRWQTLRHAMPGIRIRDAAQKLQVSEAELLIAGGESPVIRLAPDWPRLLRKLESLGRVMALTRNECAVHETIGVYRNIQINHHKAIICSDSLDLRLHLQHWRFAFAVTEKTASGPRQSLQFFDLNGTAAHKVYLTQDSDSQAYAALIATFRLPEQDRMLNVAPLPNAHSAALELDVRELRHRWRNLTNIHDFEKLLRHFRISRFEAVALVGAEFALRIADGLFHDFMRKISDIRLPTMIFVSNRSAVQIHSGMIRKLRLAGDWFNILDPDFNLHLKLSAIDSLWVVTKPGSIGQITSLELYDAEGEPIALIFGEYTPGQGEEPTWRDLLLSLPEYKEAS